jgi:hypothetical protein
MKYLLSLAVAALASGLAAQEYTVDFKMNNPDGIYKKGEKIVVSAQLLEDGKPAKDKILRYVLSHDTEDIKTVDTPSDAPVAIETTMDHPGWCRVVMFGMGQDKKTLKSTANGSQRDAVFAIGAMVDPLELKEGAPTP